MSVVKRIFLLLCLIAIVGCDNKENAIPSMPVQFVYNVLAEDPVFVPENTCTYRIFSECRYETDYIGFAGLLLYIGMDRQYHAWDIACPKCLSIKKTIYVDGLYAICPICDEHYDLSYGLATPSMGISNYPLRAYRCVWNGTTLTVTN